MKKKFGLLALTGVIALASCSQGTGSTPGVTQHKLTINVAGPASASATISGSTTQTVTVPSTTTLDAGTYTVTPAAVTGYTTPGNQTVDLSTSDKTITLTYTTGPIVNPPPASGATITITSPANGASVTGGQPLQVTFSTTGTLTGITCSVNGSTATPSTATVSNTGGFCTVTANPTGSTVITVSGKDSANNTVSTSVAVASPNVNTGPISFDPAQEIKLGADGTVDDSKNDATDITARVSTNDGWRQIGQGLSTGAAPSSDVYTYVKGKVNVNFAAPAGAQKVEVFLARTTGSDVPTNDDIQAKDLIQAFVSPTGTVSTVFDSTQLGEFQAVPEWLVFRVDGTQLFFVRVVADNTAPQPARPDFQGANGAGNNVIRNFRGIQNNNFARGQINVFTTNRDLQDQPFGRAPVTSTVAQLRPSGFESIRYFLVPSALVDVTPGLRDSDGVRLAKAIRFAFKSGQGVIASAPQLSVGASGDFRTLFDSSTTTVCNTTGTGTTAPKAAGFVPDGKYRLFALTRDQIGNEAASPEYQVVTFDNVGPNVSGVSLRDASPLPFPSTNPVRFISDVAQFSGGTITDVGIGFPDNSPFFATIGGTNANPVKIPVNATPVAGNNGNINGYTISSATFDTNVIADGNQTVGFNSFADALGNPATNCAPQQIVIDNTDPSVNFNRINSNGVVESGTPLSLETQASDSTSGVYTSILFWNDFAGTDAARTRTRAQGFVGAPVEIKRIYNGLDLLPNDGSQTNVANNATWNALYPVATNNVLPYPPLAMNLNVVVVDRAGNTTVLTRDLQVVPRTTNLNTPTNPNLPNVPLPFVLPTLGASDGYRFDRAANHLATPSRFINPVGANGTTLADAGKPLNASTLTLPSIDAVLSLATNGTSTQNGFGLTNTNGGSVAAGYDKINSVTGYGGFDRTDWGKVITYLNTQPSAATVDTFQLADPSLLRQSNQNPNQQQFNILDSNLYQVRIDSRTLSDGTFASGSIAANSATGTFTANAAPWFKLGDLSTANQFYKVNSDLLNNLYWTRGYDSSTYNYLTGASLKATYDEITGVVTDSAGAYNFYGEKTGR